MEMGVGVQASVGIVRPGDKLVVALGRYVPQDEADDLKGQFEANLSGVEAVIIEADALVVYRG
jgi:hypothetical protein